MPNASSCDPLIFMHATYVPCEAPDAVLDLPLDALWVWRRQAEARQEAAHAGMRSCEELCDEVGGRCQHEVQDGDRDDTCVHGLADEGQAHDGQGDLTLNHVFNLPSAQSGRERLT